MELPRPLIRWGAYLELFPLELATALGPLVQRLDLVIGPLQTSDRQGDGDPDGFHGITRRGSYERLLISEWLLADEFPDEFARRAAMGEHGFLEPARRQPAGSRTSIALFDAGPDQFGAPRIAHLAALIVLARRAETAGICFQWGVLQQPAGTLHASVTASTILQLLQARSCRAATDQDITTWRDVAGSQIEVDDLWIVGAPRLSALPAASGTSLLQIGDSYTPEANHLNAVVVDRGRAKPTVTLELPPDTACVRLLRDPFLTRRTAPTRTYGRFTPTSNLIFAPGGNKLMARSGTDHLIVYPIPNSPHAQPGKPKIYHTEIPRPIFSVGRVGKNLALVTTAHEPDVLQIECVIKKSGKFETISFLVPPDIDIRSPEATDPLTPCFHWEGASHDRQWLVLIDNTLLRPRSYVNRSAVQYAIVEMEHVIATGLTPDGWSFITRENSKWMQVYILGDGTKQSVDLSSFRYPQFEQTSSGGFRPETICDALRQSFHHSVLTVLFGYGGHPAESIFGIQVSDEQWIITSREGDATLFSVEDRVVGVVSLKGEGITGPHQSGFEPGLILLRKDRRRITVMGQSWVRSVPPASSQIVHITASLYRPDIAYLTEQGELVVYSLQQEAVLCRFITGATL